MKNILVLSVHPDDETLGCGGTILKHLEDGDHLYWIIGTNISDENRWGIKKIKNRQEEIKKVAKEYNFKKVINLDYESTKLDEVPFSKIVEKISQVIKSIQPQIIYLNNRSDIHSEHKIFFEAVISASKIFNHSYIKRILMYETISETDFAPALPETIFLPNIFVDITKYLKKKIEIMQIYSSELGVHPFPRSEKNIEALAVTRGAQAGSEYAEAFMLVKEIWK